MSNIDLAGSGDPGERPPVESGILLAARNDGEAPEAAPCRGTGPQPGSAVVHRGASGFPLVQLPTHRVLQDRFSVTFGRAYNSCQRAAFLYQLHGRTPAQTAAMARGSVLHRVAQLDVEAAIAADETKVPPELSKAIVNEVLADPQYWVEFQEHDYIRECAYRIGEELVIDPGAVVACETLFVLEVDGWSVRGKIDLAMLIERGAAISIRDWKSSRALPPYEDIGRKRPDGTIAAKDYQLVLYALLLAFGRPVRFEAVSDSTSTENNHVVTDSAREYVEVVEPFGVADRVQRFDLSYVYPGIVGSDGLMATRGVSLTRIELGEYLESLKAQVAQIKSSVASGDWPATYGSHCVECPAPAECPIPVALRDHAGEINTREQAVEAASRLNVEKDQLAARQKELTLWVKAQPIGERKLRYGRDRVIDIGYQESVRIPDRDAMFDAMARAVEYGEPFDRAAWVKTSTSTPIKDRRLTEDELSAEAEEREASA